MTHASLRQAEREIEFPLEALKAKGQAKTWGQAASSWFGGGAASPVAAPAKAKGWFS